MAAPVAYSKPNPCAGPPCDKGRRHSWIFRTLQCERTRSLYSCRICEAFVYVQHPYVERPHWNRSPSPDPEPSWSDEPSPTHECPERHDIDFSDDDSNDVCAPEVPVGTHPTPEVPCADTGEVVGMSLRDEEGVHEFNCKRHDWEITHSEQTPGATRHVTHHNCACGALKIAYRDIAAA